MKRLFKITVVLFVLGSLCLSCHKYPEDPFISLRRPYKRIEGTWNITSYQIWGKEHSHDFDSLLSPRTLTDYYIKFAPYDLLYKGQLTFVDRNNHTLSEYSQYEFSGGGSYPTKELWIHTPTQVADTTFFNLFFWGTKANIVFGTNYQPYWYIVELYGKNFHISRDGTDIYFKKQ